MSVKIEWSEEYEEIRGSLKGLYSWVESMLTFCKSQRNIKSNQVMWGLQVSLWSGGPGHCKFKVFTSFTSGNLAPS